MVFDYNGVICGFILILNFRTYLTAGLADLTSWPFVRTDFSFSTQSPINIEERLTHAVNLPKLDIYINWNVSKRSVNITNSGYTICVRMVTGEEDEAPIMTNGPLDGVYVFHELHLHWGDEHGCGSEHWINGKCLSEEAHIVFRNAKYRTFEEAHSEKNGLAVIGIFGMAVNDENRLLKSLVKKIDVVREPRSWTLGSFYDEFSWLAEVLDHRYVTYSGSLTTPPYTEGVIWILFLKPFLISHKQLQKFKELLDENRSIIKCNDRSLQLYHGQPIILPYDSSPVRMILQFESN